MTEDEEDNWCINCIPENEELEPQPEELESFYQQLEQGITLELQWKCPGRRPPSPVITGKPEVLTTPEKEPVVKNKEFDFMDEVVTPTMRVRNISTPNRSAKKKTANFSNILDSMKKQSRLSHGSATAKDAQTSSTAASSAHR